MKLAFPLLLAAAGIASSALAQEVKGDAIAGQKKAAMCIGCHGIPNYQATFPEIHKVPMIAGQSEKYLDLALVAYQKGDRKHPTMRAIAASLTPQDMADLATYFAQLSPAAGDKPASVAQPSERAQKVLQGGNCAACHGQDFASPIDPSYPKLAGQHADYLYVAAHSYMVENNPIRGRNHPVMAGTIKAISGSLGEKEFLADMQEVSKYLSQLPSNLKTVPESRFR